MELTGQQWQQLTDALVEAFPSYARMSQMVRFRLARNLATISGDPSLTTVAFELIGTSQAEGWTPRLLLAARESNPGNPRLLAFSQQFELAPATPPRPELEKIIRKTNKFLDVNTWRERLGQVEAQVCRVEVKAGSGDTEYGTGFLLGSSVVMTNYHVMQRVIENQQARPEDVILRFDYKRIKDGTVLNPGKEYRLAADDWLIDKSPPSPVDTKPEPKNGVPQADQLDYALLRVDGAPGDEAVGANPEPEAPPRGWIVPPAAEYLFEPGTALYIVQHPRSDPLKLAIDMEAIIGTNANGTRVTYRTNTEPGSSGSPCFNIDWELVALHHSGDPAYKPTFNEGIPIKAIFGLIEQRGFTDQLGKQEL